MNMNRQFCSQGNTKKIIAIILLVAVVIIAAVILVFSANKTAKEEETNNYSAEAPKPSEDGIPQVFYSYLGTIQKLENGKIAILAEKSKNYLLADAQITILTDEETVYLKTIIPQTISEKNAEIEIEKLAASASDLKVGDEIIAISSNNIKNKKEFLAIQIEIREVK